MSRNSKFIAMWDCTGLECMFDITDCNHDMMISKLKGQEYKVPFDISMLMMRARYNSQRQYEIYSFEVEAELELSDMKRMFNANPQYFVDLIRKNGHKIYSDYMPEGKKVIS